MSNPKLSPNATLLIRFNAFIHRDATPIEGEWAVEPMGKTGGPLSGGVEQEFQFRGDVRGFGEPGTARLYHVIQLPLQQIGRLDRQMPYERWITSDADDSHQRSRHRTNDLFRTSAWSPWGKKVRKTTVNSEIKQVGPSSLTVIGKAPYAFNRVWFNDSNWKESPDIDYELTLVFRWIRPDQLEIEASGSHNEFPFYELLIDGQVAWRFRPTDKNVRGGPGVINLNSSEEFRKRIVLTIKPGDIFQIGTSTRSPHLTPMTR